MSEWASKPLRIALLTHSTHPRGAVVHALELGHALQAAGHRVTVLAPDPSGTGFFRTVRCATAGIPAQVCRGGLADLVAQRIGEIAGYLRRTDLAQWDILHAQDSISANALAILVEQGAIRGFVRTVHHLDTFDDARLAAWQRRAYETAARVLCVSRTWCDHMHRLGIDARQVNNAVDTRRFSADIDAATAAHDARVRRRYGIVGAPVFLAVGGIEERKNTLRIFDAFAALRFAFPAAQLVIAGGASLLDHSAYRGRFEAAVRARGVSTGPGGALIMTGPVADDELPALYRSATALVFASVKEGFGLAVLEAMASGVPAVVSGIAPFTEYLHQGDCVWADPYDVNSIAAAMRMACEPAVAAPLRDAGRAVAARFTWEASARRHIDIYRQWLGEAAQPVPEETHA